MPRKISSSEGGSFEDIVINPMLAKQELEVMCVKASIDPSKSREGAMTFNATFRTTGTSKGIDEKEHGPGIIINFAMADTPTDKLTEESILKRYKELMLCFGLSCDTDEFDETLLHNQLGRVVVGMQKGTNGYADKNAIQRFIPVP